MKVLCINDNFYLDKNRPWFKYIKELPKELTEYTVIYQDENGGYVLEEINAGIFPNGNPVTFKADRFIKLNTLQVEQNIYSYKVEMQFDIWTEC